MRGNSARRAGSSGDRAWNDPDDVPWTLLDREELAAAYWAVVAPAFAEAGHDPETERPSHAWLSAHGFRGLVYALREYHDRTFGAFWAEDLGLDADEGYDWGIDHEPTVELLEAYLESRRERGDLRASSVETLRSRLARYVRAYARANGTADVVGPVARERETPAYAATDAAWRAFDVLDDELAPRTVRRIHGAVDGWYAHLVRRKRAGINPVADLDEEYGWHRGEGDATNPALAPEHVRALYDAADGPAERLLVVACCAWGLRSGEVAALHVDQLVLDPDDPDAVPYVRFDERKNGPGQVSVLYGAAVARRRVAALADREGWTGYLFPSRRSASGHVTGQTVRNRFDDLVERAGVPAIGGRRPVPQMGRRFWYDAYTATQEAVLREVEAIAAEQGSASAEVVLADYLSPERRRKLRRRAMAERLGRAFEGVASRP